ncbi:Murein tetrapeptide carboxypeptidase [Kingella potus]|uniref:Murein tetrapeptide carboxypeptidase n=1 Tax=Kingella potus TaxID=265175 RepID=A0A377QYK6_9NEIS|nr:LD-carboxypeptidase [Kingella potus]UOP01802.1 LD-carboxypeptidase [Kingella potus]STQ99885.1 Murein tetrapeptide carboxypeptidase [Kingella potus]
MNWQISRRSLFRVSAAMAGAGVLQACTGGTPPVQPQIAPKPQPQPAPVRQSGGNTLRIAAPSGFAPDPARAQTGIERLQNAGFAVENPAAAFRRYQRFAGSDAERIADVQDIASGRAAVPKVLMGLRGGYGAQRLLPHIDFASLASRMREHGTLFFGFSDVCALQLALLAQGGYPSFAGPMVYSEFGKPVPSAYTMDSFVQCTTSAGYTVSVAAFQQHNANIDGTLWGGNLSVLAALAGSPYLPDIKGGILFLEDVGEQPYRIERMLQTLLHAGVLQKQQAVVFGDFRMGSIRDVYDGSYDFNAVVQAVSRMARVPVLTGFPFGHIANKTTFPLGAQAQIRSTGGGYSVAFSGYPVLDKNSLNLDSLLPQPDFAGDTPFTEEKADLE